MQGNCTIFYITFKKYKKIGECDVAVEHLVAVVTIVVGVAMVT